jgi:LeuA-like protein with dimerisation domain
MTTDKLALVAFRVVVSTDRRSYAAVTISWGGRDHAEAEAEGNGPMDALFRATDAAVGVRGRSRAFASTLSTTTVWSGRHESRLALRAESRGDEARVRMRSRRRLTPTCARSQPTSPTRFQDPARSKRLRQPAKEHPRLEQRWQRGRRRPILRA